MNALQNDQKQVTDRQNASQIRRLTERGHLKIIETGDIES